MEQKILEEQKIRDEAEREEQSYLGNQRSGARGYNGGKSQNAPGHYQKKDYGNNGRSDGGRPRKNDYDDRK